VLAHRAKAGLPWWVKLFLPLGFCHVSKVAKNLLCSPWRGLCSLGHSLIFSIWLLSDLPRFAFTSGSLWRALSPWPGLELARPRHRILDSGTYCLSSLCSRPRLAMASLTLCFFLFPCFLSVLASIFLHKMLVLDIKSIK